ncbi:MAG TPA: 4-hydroxy-tetrahydrodipicolinate reductase [Alphaproteobacteria bacterium]|nr:4-hydroxy-tetrahydrodipicolinate reductase [Alphaproteobacteria bacterium]
MGALLVREILSGAWDGATLAGASVGPGESLDGDFFLTREPEALFERADVVVDFTTPQSTRAHIDLAARLGKPCVIGTTGLNADDERALKDAARTAPILSAANMSAGVTLLCALVEQAAAALGPEWDIEIFEAHHRAKVDAPSGTALALGRSAASGRGLSGAGASENDPFTFARHGKTGARTEGTIGFSVARGGDVVGDHTVFFYGAGERIELTHRATDRALFARGAIRAALWLPGRPPGLYTMRDVLGLSKEAMFR